MMYSRCPPQRKSLRQSPLVCGGHSILFMKSTKPGKECALESIYIVESLSVD